MSAAIKTFYVFHGTDEFSLKNEIRQIRARMGDPQVADLNTTTLDGKTTSVVDVLASARSFPFLSDKRLVIVEGLLTWLTRKGAGKTGKSDLDALAGELPQLPDTTRLVFADYVVLDEAHPILHLARRDPHGFVKAFQPPDNPMQWIMQRVQHYGGQIEPSAAAALGTVAGSDLRALDSECYKLITFAGPDRPINESDIAALTSYVPETNVFAVVDAIAKRDGNEALTLVHRLLNTTKQDAFSLFGAINRQFRLLLMIREAVDANANPRQIPDLQRIPGFKRDFLIRQAHTFTLEQLEGIYRALLEVDHDFKQGRIKDDLALDLLVAGLVE
jgi:DNA polymerase-3 subunit delta